MDKLRLLDLFSGIGGFSLGLERTGGFETVAFCEIEEFPRKVLKKHWPEVPCYHDIRELTATRLRDDGISVNAICGGFPCQDISTAGKGEGIEGERSGLWREYARLIGELRPQVVFVENVSALLSRGLSRVLGDLAEVGYDAEWHCISAAHVGAPHLRDRLWITAHPQHTNTDSQRPYRTGVHVNGGAKSRDEQERKSGQVCEVFSDTNSERGRGGNPQRKNASNAWQLPLSARIDARRMEGWKPEPDVGRGFDGFPYWLYQCVGKGISYAESYRRSEVLRRVWSKNAAQALSWAARGLERLQKAEILFSFVREYEEGSDEARLLLEGSEASEVFLRGLRRQAEIARPSYRSGHNQQRCAEHPDTLRELSQFLARDGETDWEIHSWEDATPRVALKVPNRVDRLKALGNAVVPQIPELLGNAYLESIGWKEAA